MGRYATLNPDTKDIVNCLLPGIAANFGVANVVDVIPEDVRMRAWDTDRRKHIIAQTEDDPRNWGVQFLKDLVTISRLNNGNLAEFQKKLKAKIEKHDDDHLWCRLADIKEIREEYENPPRPKDEAVEESSTESSSEDSYYEELVEPPKNPKHRGRRPRNHEVYEARPQKKDVKKRKHRTKRLRRDSSVGWERLEKRRPSGVSVDHRLTPAARGVSIFRQSARLSEREGSIDFDVDEDDLDVQQAKAELAASEAELRTAKAKLNLIEAKKRKGAKRASTA